VMQREDVGKWIRGALVEFVAKDARNSLPAHGGARIYDAPIVGFACTGDPLFDTLKKPEVVGPKHRSPLEWLEVAETVISYFLPFTEYVRESNRTEGLPSEQWVSARIDGEAFNNCVRRHCLELLEKAGERATVPPFVKDFSIVDRRSNWSERHVAYIAGLGTFGLSKSLITARGSAGRYGSVITTAKIAPTPRTAATWYEACPFLTSGACGDCIARCPSGAITEQGKDVAKCSNYLDTVVRPKFAPRYGCAKCQTNVLCESQSPQ